MIVIAPQNSFERPIAPLPNETVEKSILGKASPSGDPRRDRFLAWKACFAPPGLRSAPQRSVPYRCCGPERTMPIVHPLSIWRVGWSGSAGIATGTAQRVTDLVRSVERNNRTKTQNRARVWKLIPDLKTADKKRFGV